MHCLFKKFSAFGKFVCVPRTEHTWSPIRIENPGSPTDTFPFKISDDRISIFTVFCHSFFFHCKTDLSCNDRIIICRKSKIFFLLWFEWFIPFVRIGMCNIGNPFRLNWFNKERCKIICPIETGNQRNIFIIERTDDCDHIFVHLFPFTP